MTASFHTKEAWRRGWDSNPRKGLTPLNGLANRRLQPLGHPSAGSRIRAGAHHDVRPIASRAIHSRGQTSAVLNAAEAHWRPVAPVRGMVVSSDCCSVGETARGTRLGASKRADSNAKRPGIPSRVSDAEGVRKSPENDPA